MSALQTIGAYTAREMAQLAGVSPQKVGQWARRKVILPSVSQRPHVYSYADAGEAILAHYLTDQELRIADVKEIVLKLRDQHGPWPLAQAPLAHDGKLVLVRGQDGEWSSVQRDEHKVIEGTLLDLRYIRGALGRGGWVSLKTPREHIEVNPDRHSGMPVVRGSRMPTWRVASLAGRHDGWAALRDDYGLSDAQIDDAVGYEADVARLVA